MLVCNSLQVNSEDIYFSLQVNGKDVRKASHQEAVTALIAPTLEIVLLIRHDPQPPGLQVTIDM